MENPPHVDRKALLRESRAIQEEATRLMREFRLVEQFQQYGEVEPDGSYRWDRRTILRLKHLRNCGHLNCDGFHLYEAVLLGGAREPEEVRAWLDREAGK